MEIFLITYLGFVFVVPLMIMIFIAFELLNLVTYLTLKKNDKTPNIR